jgi:hypothetical protein
MEEDQSKELDPLMRETTTTLPELLLVPINQNSTQLRLRTSECTSVLADDRFMAFGHEVVTKLQPVANCLPFARKEKELRRNLCTTLRRYSHQSVCFSLHF